jgi:sugar-specific transcriptional regulator TrmB
MESRINYVKINLMNMGLNEYQASALSHLLYLGETKATILSKASSVPQARIYGVLDELSQKGLIIIRPGRPALYAPLSPEEISDALISASRGELREKLSVIESYKDELEESSDFIYLKAGTSEPRRSLIRIISVGDVSLEETRKIYNFAQDTLLISTRAMEYLNQVVEELKDSILRNVQVKILMREPSTLSLNDKQKQEEAIEIIQSISNLIEIRFSKQVEIRGCIADPSVKGQALFLVEEEGVPLFLREAALTSHPGVVSALDSMFNLKWKFDSKPLKTI